MKPMAAFTDLAVANVASTDFCSGGANADNQFRTRRARKADMIASPDSLRRDLCKILPI